MTYVTNRNASVILVPVAVYVGMGDPDDLAGEPYLLKGREAGGGREGGGEGGGEVCRGGGKEAGEVCLLTIVQWLHKLSSTSCRQAVARKEGTGRRSREGVSASCPVLRGKFRVGRAVQTEKGENHETHGKSM